MFVVILVGMVRSLWGSSFWDWKTDPVQVRRGFKKTNLGILEAIFFREHHMP